MAHFEDVGVEIGSGGQELGFDGSLHVAGEQKGSRPKADPKDQRVVIAGLAGGVVAGRSQDFNPRARQFERSGGMLPD